MARHNLLDVLLRYHKYLNILVTQDDLEKALTIQFNQDKLSIITTAFNRLNIPTKVFFAAPEKLDSITSPFITRLSFNKDEFVFVEQSSNGEFIISNNRYAELSMSANEFEQVFSGLVLVAEARQDLSEDNYVQKTKDKPDFKLSKKLGYSKNALKPSFLVIGAQKAGTSAFYDYLDLHPDFKKPSKKEIHFFDLNYHKGVGWYHDQFPSTENHSDFTGEATPYYQFHPLVPQRVSKYVPPIKIVSLLRDPVERAYSQYQMNIAKGFEKLSFEDAIQMENERIQPELKKIMNRKNYNSFSYQKFSYLNRGIYSEQIKLWLNFFKRDQILFIKSENLKNDPGGVFERFCRFMDIPEFTLTKTIETNSRIYPPMLPETKQKLEIFFKPYNDELRNLIDID